ncbi:rod shape-determining protein RodA [Candidatus Giovannonibacteria bacterium RIFCSPHIGHO2_12_44_12]|uniref:Rod shape-determining protein RodA n=5 Tax=Candidatus Giovannoniibacteriota TaxID=1752738 RepID=A0A1F5WY87_9BACT|nr:MAG: Rod shape-determining protein RodA [Candidatus Giovannonibacteria bacterium GW2011_GWC2_44_8]OGF73290.1 MAG: rod shape-determining protein RodA [Candidatus Giovannonibacteria bacterium RIFCSPHIGHO2_02_43_16]OGF80563.1 MAG: rod shape-determining protein RodA [Candidatus Giovannonibacteria bacterium RIFCSPHIGHO2_12_44_12]OGF84200.1 MAG: rod shape-determining protein RodA [Candidatus Giovannonibacteria bacterium RIFCSPLOWO2_02_44_8]OGF95757.1 MAG: rod shape-determining protein RodA [Candid
MAKIFTRPNIDIILVAAIIPLFLAGLITMKGLGNLDATGILDANYYFNRQVIWILAGFFLFFLASAVDWRILRSGWLLLFLYTAGILILIALLVLANAVRGARAWIQFGLFSIEPAEIMKLILILVLAKYFSRRHVEIAHVKHIIISGIYAAIPTLLIFLQPDLGSAIIYASIWLGMILVSGVSKKHLFSVLILGVTVFLVSWLYILEPYQKARIFTFINPAADPRGAGYNALQSMIAVGSGGVFGRGVGYGAQSRLEFLPEHETDFIFAAFAEEWGLVGVLVLFAFYALLLWRILNAAFKGESNFEKLFGIGLFFMILSHFIIHIGMNLGVLPITGISLPFLSYGGSHTITLLLGLGILMGMQKYGFASSRLAAVNKDLTLV